MKFDHDSVVFIHIPCTAGSYIEKELCKKHRCVGALRWPKPNTTNLFGFKKVSNNNYLTLQHLTLNEMMKFNFLKRKENQYIFTVIRHPYTRVLSLYRRLRPFKTLDLFLDKLIDMQLDKYAHNGIITKNKNFNCLKMESNLKDIKYFVIPQYYYIKNNDNYHVNIIEYGDIEKLNDKLGLKLKFKKQKHNNFLTKRQKDKIYRIYRIDFDRFNFTK